MLDRGHSRQVLDVLWLLKVLEIVEVCHKFGIIEPLLCGQVIQVKRIGEGLNKLGVVNKISVLNEL